MGNAYQVENVGSFVRVSHILGMANFAGDVLDKWKRKRFDKSLSKLGDSSYSKIELIKHATIAYEDPQRYMKDSSVFGNALHDWFEQYLNTWVEAALPTSDYADSAICADSIRLFCKEWGINKDNVETVKAECLLWSTKYKYAGTCDYLCKKQGKLYLMDWKTTNSFHEKYYLQVAAYWMALTETFGLDIEEAYIITFNKSSIGYTHNVVTKQQLDYYFKLFLCCLNLYNFAHSKDRLGVPCVY
jgi:hypothetical protein